MRIAFLVLSIQLVSVADEMMNAKRIALACRSSRGPSGIRAG
jgi:hypothetical protein